jgi:hypothetical protein
MGVRIIMDALACMVRAGHLPKRKKRTGGK